ADQQHIDVRALLIVRECERIAAQFVADAPPRFGTPVELQVEDDLAAAQQVATEPVGSRRPTERPLGASLAEPAPEPLVLGAEASFDQLTEKARDGSPVLEVGD